MIEIDAATLGEQSFVRKQQRLLKLQQNNKKQVRLYFGCALL